MKEGKNKIPIADMKFICPICDTEMVYSDIVKGFVCPNCGFVITPLS